MYVTPPATVAVADQTQQPNELQCLRMPTGSLRASHHSDSCLAPHTALSMPCGRRDDCKCGMTVT
jgi:hypothetical protein